MKMHHMVRNRALEGLRRGKETVLKVMEMVRIAHLK